jgi:hypothetical protein
MAEQRNPLALEPAQSFGAFSKTAFAGGAVLENETASPWPLRT